jgi:hypothetical protein
VWDEVYGLLNHRPRGVWADAVLQPDTLEHQFMSFAPRFDSFATCFADYSGYVSHVPEKPNTTFRVMMLLRIVWSFGDLGCNDGVSTERTPMRMNSQEGIGVVQIQSIFSYYPGNILCNERTLHKMRGNS